MACYLGIDTSNYTTSVALYDDVQNTITQHKQLLPVKQGELGLRQSDAVFAHVKQLPALLETLTQNGAKPDAVGVSTCPRDVEGSYMPCFLAGESAARAIAAAAHLPLTCVSHQAGHIAAALYSAGKLAWMRQEFVAFHFSGGTTECLLVRPGTEHPFAVQLLATSLDLKAGQAIDRVGAMLGLPFPAGKHLEALALQSAQRYRVKPTFHGFDCCLSGLENQCRKLLQDKASPADVARFCLDSILAVALEMTKQVHARFGALPILYAGGVMSNSILQKELAGHGAFAAPEFSSDNAAGVAVLAYFAGQGGTL